MKNTTMKQGTLTLYVTGFVFSIALTLAAFFVVEYPSYWNMSAGAVLTTILALAIVQLIVQLYFFLEVSFASGERWKMAAFVSTIIFVLIIVIGSLWIMNHLDYNMTPAQMQDYINNQQGGF